MIVDTRVSMLRPGDKTLGSRLVIENVSYPERGYCHVRIRRASGAVSVVTWRASTTMRVEREGEIEKPGNLFLVSGV